MQLYDYNTKRDFTKTKEPAGKVSATPSRDFIFVVQKHHASHLHYDFRLEYNGVLKSWAVPKGPSANPADKRLAMMVEDHPYDYRNFEGTIPSGEYGAGEVIVWDNGIYDVVGKTKKEKEKTIAEGLKKGHLVFTLYGKKLQGEYALVKQHQGDENAWMLIKKADEYASERDVRENDRSVLSNRRLGDRGNIENLLTVSDISGAEKQPFFHQIKPMLAKAGAKSFSSDEWLFEIKWDGYRAIAEVEKGEVRLYSRNGNDFSRRYSPITEALTQIPHDLTLDGEICVLDREGKSKFQYLQEYQEKKKGQLVYVIFDLLYLDGYDLRSVPLIDRKRLLKQTLLWNSTLYYSDQIEGEGEKFFALAKQQGLEGIMAKKKDSLYYMGVRSDSWLKIKAKQQQEAIICGYTQPRGSRSDIGALILGVYKDKELTYIGHTGTGFSRKSLSAVKKLLDGYKRDTSPFSDPPQPNAPVQWVEPKILCEVGFSEWTNEGVMRHPVFLGLRDDKAATDVVKEDSSLQGKRKTRDVILESSDFSRISQVRPSNKRNYSTQSAALGLERNNKKTKEMPDSASMTRKEFSHLNKLYWPEEGISKGDMLAYYKEITPIIFPYLKDRPQTLHRFPSGITASGFYQKDILSHPDWITTVTVPSESEDKDIHYIVADTPEVILYLANLGCIEMNPWNSRIGKLDYPDYLVIDLDPEDISFEHVVDTAHTVRDLLERAEIPSFCKTSGATGLHIYIPLGAKYTDDVSRQFAELLARLTQKSCPEYTSVVRSPAKRQKKVYVDFLQNRFGQTLASAYSLRPKPGATVSTPLLWSEVNKDLHPSQFTMKNMLQRIDRVGDLWKGVLGEGIDIEKSLKNVQKLLEE